MSVDTLALLGLSLEEVEIQRTTKRPRMLGFKTSQRGVEKIKKIRERELRRLEAMVGVPLTWGPRATSTWQPFDPCFSSRDLDGNEIRPSITSFHCRTCSFRTILYLILIFLLSMNG